MWWSFHFGRLCAGEGSEDGSLDLEKARIWLDQGG